MNNGTGLIAPLVQNFFTHQSCLPTPRKPADRGQLS